MPAGRIEGSIVVDAPVERVWTIVTDARHLARWNACVDVELELRPFGRIVFHRRGRGALHGLLATLEPPNALSFLFAAHTPDEPARLSNSTLVELTLEPAGCATRVRVFESGFEQLEAPPVRQSQLATESRRAWTARLGMMRALAERSLSLQLHA
jgi:uncharacterized protein YndB with AHSA1/START domain